jgi:hypothetical protein
MKLIDLTGERFGRWSVLHRMGTKWFCQCDCGKTKEVDGNSLRYGLSASCGCSLKDNPSHFCDLTEQRFGRLVVISRNNDKKSGNAKWNCLCDCGTMTVVSSPNLKSNHTKSCGCFKAERDQSQAEDLTGEKFNRLTVRRRVPGRKKPPAWDCVCECGNETIVTSSELKYGGTKSCGCLHIERAQSQLQDLTGQQFGSWTVLELAQRSPSYWKCKCACGAILDISGSSLKRGTSKSCGCSGESGFKPNKPAIFYYLKVSNPYGAPLFKIGITNRSIKERFQDDSGKYEELLVAKFTSGINAWKLEQALLKGFAPYAYSGPAVLTSGNSELFTKDILNLDAASNNPHVTEMHYDYSNAG